MTTEQPEGLNQFPVRAGSTVAITVPEEIAVIREQWRTGKHAELERAQTALANLIEAGASDRKVRRVKERVSLLRSCVRALDNGYIPIPRFDSNALRLDHEELPLKAIVAVNAAATHKIFNEFRFITGREGENRRGQRGRLAQRDPIIVGVVRTPSVCIDRSTWGQFLSEEAMQTTHRQHNLHQHWQAEEHFLVAWWRPEDERMEDMF